MVAFDMNENENKIVKNTGINTAYIKIYFEGKSNSKIIERFI